MFTILFEIKTRARTWRGLNRTIALQTGNENWFESHDDLARQVKEGWITFTRDSMICWQDC